MAYDPNLSYEAPRRPYYGQAQQRQQQQAPVQNGSRKQQHEQYEQYDEYRGGGYEQQYDDRGYDQQHDNNDYAQSYGQYNAPPARDVRRPQQPQKQRYDAGYQASQQQSYDHPQAYDQRQRERQYDPRYQKRPEVGREKSHERQPQQSPPERQVQPMQPAPQPRPNPRDARQYSNQAQPKQQQQQQQQQYQQEQQSTSHMSSSRGQPNGTAPWPQPEPSKDPSKASMQEWKAKERARMHAAMQPPETVAQDNAFPTFPAIQQKKDRSRPATATNDPAAAETATGLRSSEDYGAPVTATSHQREARPPVSRGDSHNSETPPQSGHSARPPMERKPFSYDSAKERAGQRDHQSPPPNRPSYQRQFSDQVGSPVRERPSDSRQMHDSHQPSPDRRKERQRAPSLPNGPNQQHAEDGQRQYPDQDSAQRQTPRQAPPRAINIRQAQQQPHSAYMDHHPLSPAYVAPRPSTAEGTGGLTGAAVASPLAQSWQSRALQEDVFIPPPKPYAQLQHDPDHYDLGELYDGYQGDDHVPPPATGPSRTREEEIEAEMPDFDSAAPSQTSNLHKRAQVIDPTVAVPGLPAQGRTPSAQPPHAQQRFQAPQQEFRSMSVPAQPFAPKQRPSDIDDGFVFDLPGETNAQSHDPYDQFGEQQQQPRPQSRGTPHQQRLPPVQPPFANNQGPRHSMDDARQMPYRQGPPHPQRFPPNGQAWRGPHPPQQRRPESDRDSSEQSGRAARFDYGQQRVGSAPPPREGFNPPPGPRANGTPLSQQRSNPEREGSLYGDGNPDSLPHHPTPVRPGTMDRGPNPPTKPPPVRNYDSRPASSNQPQQASIEPSSRPVTTAELDQLRHAVETQPHNPKQAFLLAKKLVEASTVLASEGGRLDARSTAKNRERYIMDAHKRIKKLVSAGYPDAQFYFADCYGQGSLGLNVDTKEAFNLYQAAAKAGHPEAAYRTAMCCEMGPEEGGGTRKDYPKAVQWYRRAATLGDPAAMYKLGIILLRGLLGQPKNIGESVTWLKRAAERADKDHPHALHELASLYEPSNTDAEVRNKIIADEQYALELFQRAAKMGHRSSQFRLGQAYEYGSLGLAIDNRASIAWYSKAAAQGDHQAELALSGWYLTGAEGILEHSDTEAYLWARKAATSEPPLAKAMFAMGYFTETGIGCPASIDEAKRWYSRAASYRFPKAQERLEELRRNPSSKVGTRPGSGRLSRKDQKRDEAECVVM